MPAPPCGRLSRPQWPASRALPVSCEPRPPTCGRRSPASASGPRRCWSGVGMPPATPPLVRLAATLQAATGDEATLAALAGGRLPKDLDPAGFGLDLAPVQAEPTATADAEPAAVAPADQADAWPEQARTAARRAMERTRQAAEQAQAVLDQAQAQAANRQQAALAARQRRGTLGQGPGVGRAGGGDRHCRRAGPSAGRCGRPRRRRGGRPSPSSPAGGRGRSCRCRDRAGGAAVATSRPESLGYRDQRTPRL